MTRENMVVPAAAADRWVLWKGRSGGVYTIISDGSGVRFTCKLGLGGFSGRSTFIRSVQFRQGDAVASAVVKQVGKTWKFYGEPPPARVLRLVWGGASGRQPAGKNASQHCFCRCFITVFCPTPVCSVGRGQEPRGKPCEAATRRHHRPGLWHAARAGNQPDPGDTHHEHPRAAARAQRWVVQRLCLPGQSCLEWATPSCKTSHLLFSVRLPPRCVHKPG